MVIIPRPELSHANFVHVSRLADARIHDFMDDVDPDDMHRAREVCVKVRKRRRDGRRQPQREAIAEF